MDFHNNPQNESGRLEQIVSQFLLKSLHIILDSRAPIRPDERKGNKPSVSRVKKSDKWFNIALSERPAALDNLNFWHRNSMDPMTIDIILVKKTPSSSFDDDLHNVSVETVIERWIVQYEYPHILVPQSCDLSAYYKITYKKLIILLRSLYSMMRILPTYRIFRQLSSSTQAYNFDIIYRVSSFSEPFSRAEEEMMKTYDFPRVEALPGHLSISVTYHPTLSDFNLESPTPLTPMIITDYVGSPATDPLRSFNSIENWFCATSFPLRDTRIPSSSPYHRPHSWTSGFHKSTAFGQNQQLSGSPVSYNTSSPSPGLYAHRTFNDRTPHHQKAISFDEYQLSPPFSSSPSPSPPTHQSFKNHLRSEKSAPLTIPSPIYGGNFKYASPNSSDPSRHSLPPPSPRSSGPGYSQDSPSGIKLGRKTDVIRTGELYPGMTNHHSSPKVVNDSKDESGRFSGLSSSSSPRIGFSRSSSRFSFHDDTEDFDISCPFDVDDINPSDANFRKSQDAAVGALVHMLRTAPPLRQDRSFYSSHSLKAEFEAETNTVSGFYLPRKTSDALEELKSYKDMKDILLSKSKA